MPGNNSGWLVHYWAGLYGRLGQVFSPGSFRKPVPHLPYALDNGAFPAFTRKMEWDESAFLKHVQNYSFLRLRPSWVVVPDVVANADLTFKKWKLWAPRLKQEFGLTVALAVQDGMEPYTVDRLRPEPELLFIGGTTEWKWKTLPVWAHEFPRVHVGRVNTADQLEKCARAGAQSCDGTGWFRGDPKQTIQLGRFLANQAGRNDDSAIADVVYGGRLDTGQTHFPMEVVA